MKRNWHAWLDKAAPAVFASDRTQQLPECGWPLGSRSSRQTCMPSQCCSLFQVISDPELGSNPRNPNHTAPILLPRLSRANNRSTSHTPSRGHLKTRAGPSKALTCWWYAGTSGLLLPLQNARSHRACEHPQRGAQGEQEFFPGQRVAITIYQSYKYISCELLRRVMV